MSSCDIAIKDMKDPLVAERARQLGIRSVPAVVIDGSWWAVTAGANASSRRHRRSVVRVEVFYIDGCPNRQRTVERVKALLNELHSFAELIEVPVTDLGSALRMAFLVLQRFE